jgi:hypothetical protein
MAFTHQFSSFLLFVWLINDGSCAELEFFKQNLRDQPPNEFDVWGNGHVPEFSSAPT